MSAFFTTEVTDRNAGFLVGFSFWARQTPPYQRLQLAFPLG